MKKQKATFFNKIIVSIAVLLATCLVLGMLASVFDPRTHLILAFFGLAYPFFLLANVLFVIWWLLRKKWLFALMTIVIIAAGRHTLSATFNPFGTEGRGEKIEAGLIRVMTYNVHNFKPYGEENTLAVKEKMLEVVQNQNPDVVCFQEFFSKKRGDYNTIKSLKEILNTKYYYFSPTMQSDSEAIGLAIFSKYPIVAKGNIVFENDGGNESIYVDLQIKNQMIRVYNVHLQSISFDKEDYTYLEKVTKKMDAEVSSTKRIVRMLRSAFKKRSAQVDLMKAHMSTCTTPYIVAGDFNDTPASYAVTKMTDSLKNAFVEQGRGLGKTYNGKFPNFQIDYIAATPHFDVTNYHIIKAKLSDHFPVRSDLRLKIINP